MGGHPTKYVTTWMMRAIIRQENFGILKGVHWSLVTGGWQVILEFCYPIFDRRRRRPFRAIWCFGMRQARFTVHRSGRAGIAVKAAIIRPPEQPGRRHRLPSPRLFPFMVGGEWLVTGAQESVPEERGFFEEGKGGIVASLYFFLAEMPRAACRDGL